MSIARSSLFALAIAAAAVGCGKKQTPVSTPNATNGDVGNGTDTSGGTGSGSAADPHANGTATDGSPPMTRHN